LATIISIPISNCPKSKWTNGGNICSIKLSSLVLSDLLTQCVSNLT
jgi:hypothetical protein